MKCFNRASRFLYFKGNIDKYHIKLNFSTKEDNEYLERENRSLIARLNYLFEVLKKF